MFRRPEMPQLAAILAAKDGERVLRLAAQLALRQSRGGTTLKLDAWLLHAEFVRKQSELERAARPRSDRRRTRPQLPPIMMADDET